MGSARTIAVTLIVVILGGAGFTSPAASQSASWPPPDTEIRALLAQRIDVAHQDQGIIVGIVDAHGERLISYGRARDGDPRPPSGRTIFELGSSTKPFTAFALADMARAGTVRLDAPVAKCLPAGMKTTRWEGSPITFLDLATHTSGLPSLPSNMVFRDYADPYPYTREQFTQLIAQYPVSPQAAGSWHYSNVGFTLLGDALAQCAGTTYEGLLERRLFAPLRMKDTRINLSAEEKTRVAQGHNRYLEPVGPIDVPGLEGSTALRSTADDVIKFLSALLDTRQTAISTDFDMMLKVSRHYPVPNMTQAIGWLVEDTPHGQIVWHDGATGGFSSFIGVNPKTRTGVVVLANVAVPRGVGEIGRYILGGTAPRALQPPPARPAVVQLTSDQRRPFVGKYRFASDQSSITISRDGDHLFLRSGAGSIYELYPTGPDSLWLKAVDLSLTFKTGADGRVTSVTSRQNGKDDLAYPVTK